MTIFFLTDQTYLHGGIEKVLAEKANYFAEVFHYNVVIITTEQKENPPCYTLSRKIRLVDIGVDYDRKKSYFSIGNLKKIPSHFKKLNRAIRDINPDVMISCNFACDFYWLPFIFKNISKFKEFHSSRYYVEKSRKSAGFPRQMMFRLNDFIESKYDKLILLNPDEKQFYHSDNLAVIPNPIEPTEITAALDAKKIIAAGRISPVKGFDNLIKAWQIVARSHPDWQLDIYGQDYLNTQSELQQLIDDLQIGQYVNFAGQSDNMRATMAEYSMYAMTSVTECFPMVLLESLSVGLPIVSFDCPTGPKHIVTNAKDGYLCGQRAEMLAEKIMLLIADSDLRKSFGMNAKANSRRFSGNEIMPLWQQLFKTPRN